MLFLYACLITSKKYCYQYGKVPVETVIKRFVILKKRRILKIELNYFLILYEIISLYSDLNENGWVDPRISLF